MFHVAQLVVRARPCPPARPMPPREGELGHGHLDLTRSPPRRDHAVPTHGYILSSSLSPSPTSTVSNSEGYDVPPRWRRAVAWTDLGAPPRGTPLLLSPAGRCRYLPHTAPEATRYVPRSVALYGSTTPPPPCLSSLPGLYTLPQVAGGRAPRRALTAPRPVRLTGQEAIGIVYLARGSAPSEVKRRPGPVAGCQVGLGRRICRRARLLATAVLLPPAASPRTQHEPRHPA